MILLFILFDHIFQWKGCSDNVLYGQRVSREWADASWRKKWHPRNNATTFTKNRNYLVILSNLKRKKKTIYFAVKKKFFLKINSFSQKFLRKKM